VGEELDDTEHLMSSENNRKRLLESIEQANAVSNEDLLDYYMLGFRDELDNLDEKEYDNPLITRAYKLGRLDAILGDDIRSVDYQSDEEIIKNIRQI
jgi:hypothetical protein